MPDSAIDFSDIPESTDRELKKARRVGRPSSRDAKQLISIRIRPSLLATIRRAARQKGEPYQTLIHEILGKAAKHFA
jgi:predicted DNA binding CopG/RHH family protein